MNKIIDIHTHMFNGHYVPLRDIFHYKFGLNERVSGALGVIVNGLVNTKPRGDDWWETDQYTEGWKAFANNAEDEEFDVEAFADRIMDTLSYQILAEASSYSANKALNNAWSSELLRALMTIVEEDAKEEGREFSREEFIENLSPHFFKTDSLYHNQKRMKGISDSFGAIGNGPMIRLLRKLGDYLGFVGKMLLHEEDLAGHLTGDNYRDEDKPALTLHLMMDMEPAYIALGGHTPPKLDYVTQQIPRTHDVTRNSHGKLLGFVAYDPRRGTEGLEIVKSAMAMGYAGVKLYPPMGYKPDDFDSFGDLYRHCEVNGIPIMTHCTPVGFIAKKNSDFGLNSDPDYWNEVLHQYNDLTLCFGHAGGGDYEVEIKDDPVNAPDTIRTEIFYGWYDPAEDDSSLWDTEYGYPRKIIDLCQLYPNVYTDLSYLHAIIGHSSKRDAFVARLRTAVGSQDGKPYDFGHKMMYGSDWHMAQIVKRTNKFLDRLQLIFSKTPELVPYTDHFFHHNAVRFLRLDEYIERHEDNYPGAHSPIGIAHLKAIMAQLPSTP